MLLSFVIGCYRSEKTISSVVDEIRNTVNSRKEYDYEIILVNDHSPDNVMVVLRELANNDEKIIVLNLAKNVGKAAAVLAGCSRANGQCVIVLDDDGQCPLDHLWELIKPLEEGHDMAIADYPVKKQSLFKNFGSKVNHVFMNWMLKQPKGIRFSNFNARQNYIIKQMCRYQNPYPNLQGLALHATNDIVMVPMEERERKVGKSGYTFWRSFKLFVNGVTGFSVVPLRLASVLGVVMSFAGFLMIIWFVIKKVLNPNILPGYTSILIFLFFIGGIIMLLLGIIGEYLGRVYISINNIPQYVIKEEINNKTENNKSSKQ